MNKFDALHQKVNLLLTGDDMPTWVMDILHNLYRSTKNMSWTKEQRDLLVKTGNANLLNLFDALEFTNKKISHKNYPTPEELMPLINVLDEIWDSIRGTDQEYTIAIQEKLTKACLLVAEYLQPILGKSRFQLMMPTIKITNSYITTTDLMEPELNLQNFVPNQHGGFIEVAACLEFAEDDGKLKYTDNYNVEMTELDQKRIINHSPETQEYWKAIQKKIRYKPDPTSIGEILKNLLDGCYNGDSHGGNGTINIFDSVAGSCSYEAIAKFAEWLETITENEKTDLMNRRNGDMNFGEVWIKLTRPELGLHCINDLAYQIKIILRCNPDLYNKGKEQDPYNNIKDLQLQLEIAKKSFITAINKPDYKVAFRFNHDGIADEFGIIRPRQQHLTNEELILELPAGHAINRIVFAGAADNEALMHAALNDIDIVRRPLNGFDGVLINLNANQREIILDVAHQEFLMRMGENAVRDFEENDPIRPRPPRPRRL